MMITSVNKLDTYTTETNKREVKKDLGKDDFLKLLVTQMQFQDPLKPMEQTQFTAQLAQFSSLDQLFGINDGMKQLTDKEGSLNGVQAVNFIGKEINAAGSSIHVGKGSSSAEIDYSLADNASEVEIHLSDINGNVVRTIKQGPQDGGIHSINWDGRDSSGREVPEGEYSFLISARDIKGKMMDVNSNITGTVTGVSFENSVPYLMVGGMKIAVSDVSEVKEGKK